MKNKENITIYTQTSHKNTFGNTHTCIKIQHIDTKFQTHNETYKHTWVHTHSYIHTRIYTLYYTHGHKMEKKKGSHLD